MNLTENFTLEEFLFSETATRYGIDNTPPDHVLMNIMETARNMERVRALLGVPIRITSGYRCQAINKLIGGANASFHILGLACDFVAPKFGNPLAICVKLAASNLRYDQLIHEFGVWVHIGFDLPDISWRMQKLTASRGPNGTQYQNGLVAV